MFFSRFIGDWNSIQLVCTDEFILLVNLSENFTVDKNVDADSNRADICLFVYILVSPDAQLEIQLESLNIKSNNNIWNHIWNFRTDFWTISGLISGFYVEFHTNESRYSTYEEHVETHLEYLNWLMSYLNQNLD